MITSHIKFSGSLFQKGITKKIIQESIQETADWTQNRLRNRSPVRTGALKAGWYVTPGSNYVKLDNPVPYTKYVEAKVGMVAKTVPEVRTKLSEILLKNTNKLK